MTHAAARDGSSKRRRDRRTPRHVSGPRRSSRHGSTLVAAGILVSRLTGLVRERFLGYYLGTGAAAGAFTVAFRIPGFLQRLVGEGALSASFIPVYSRLLAEGRDDEASRVAKAVAGLLVALTGLLTLLGLVFAEPLTAVLAAGLRSRPATFDLTVELVRIMFPAVGLLILSSWCLGVLNSHHRFFLSYVAPAIFNITQIVVLTVAGSVLVSGSRTGSLQLNQQHLTRWLAYGTVLAGLLQFAVQLPTALRLTAGARLSLRRRDPGVLQVLRNFASVAGARGVVYVATYVQVFLATFLAAGALATLRYAQVLYLLPISLFGMSVAAAELPRLSQAEDGASERTRERLERGLARISALVVPTAIGYLVVGDHITATVFQTGRFDHLDVLSVWLVLAGYSLGLVPTTSSRLLQSGLYGSGDARTPSRIAVARVAVSVLIGLALMFQFDRFELTSTGIHLAGHLPAFGPLSAAVRDPAQSIHRLGAVGVALGAACGAWLEYGLLRRAVRRRIGRTRLGGGSLARIAAAAGVAGAVDLAARPLLEPLPPVLVGIAAIVLFAGVYGAAGLLFRVPEVQSILRTLRRRS